MKISVDITNPEVEAYFHKQIKAGYTAEQVAANVLQVGVAVLERVQVSRDVEFVRKEAERMVEDFKGKVDTLGVSVQQQIEQGIGRQFNPDVTDSYSEKMVRSLRERITGFQTDVKEAVLPMIESIGKMSQDRLSTIEKGIDLARDNFNPDLSSSYLGKMRTVVEQLEQNLHRQLDDAHTSSFAYRLKSDVEALFGQNSPIISQINTLLESYTAQFHGEVVRLREAIAEKEGRQQMMSKTSSAKGAEFEEEVLLARLEEIARPAQDIVEATGRTAETGSRAKKGDYIYRLNEGPMFVIEAKDEKLGLTPALNYLDDAMSIRGVTFGVMIYRSEELVPNAARPFGFYANNKLLTSYEYTELAIRWARLYLTKVQQSAVEGVNKDAVLTSLKLIQQKFNDIKTAKNKLTGMENSVRENAEEIRKLLDLMKADILVAIHEIEEELGKGQAGDTAATDMPAGEYPPRPEQSAGQPTIFS